METKIINSICTGVPGLDDFLIWPKPLDKITKNDEKKKNGLPLGRIILLTGKAGTGKTMFAIQVAMQFLADNQQQDQAEVVFFSNTDESLHNIREDAYSRGYPKALVEGFDRFRMVTFDEIFAAAGAGRKVATNSKALLKKITLGLVEKSNQQILIIDPFSMIATTIAAGSGQGVIIDFLSSLEAVCRKRDILCFLTAVDNPWHETVLLPDSKQGNNSTKSLPYLENIVSGIIHFSFHNNSDDQEGRKISIQKMRGREVARQEHSFVITQIPFKYGEINGISLEL